MANVKVAVRVRPMSRREVESGAELIVNMNGDTASITNLKVPENSEVDSRERIRHFVFDFCYWSLMPTDPNNVTQEMIFNELGTQVLESALDGYNACILAYGQSGSGKTYTMMGTDDELGLIPRICESLFTNMSERSGKKVTFHADVSFLEIYNERVCDLLQTPFPHKNRTSLKVREHPKYGPYVQDLSKHDVPDFQTVLSLIERGNQNRSVASTESHSRSSRSHAIFTINFTQACLDAEMPSEIVSKIHLVDLAGSERASIKFNRTRLKEGSNINKSLVTLGNVISALAEKSLSSWSLDSLGSTYSLESMGSSPASSPRRIRQYFVPYRDSVLTWLLKDSLGGNSKTIMIATISPASTCYSETVGTLHYAQRAKCIVNKPVVNEDSTVKLIRDLRAEIARLRELLANAQTHDVTHTPRDEVSIAKLLNESERNASTLTKTWMEKWLESGSIVEDSEMSILKSKSSVIVDSRLPHLIVLDNHILSTGIRIYYLKHGKTRIGNDSSGCADIGVAGSTLLPEHCELDFDGSNVVLSPLSGATCFINEYIVHDPTLLRQADIVKLGSDLTLRFNHPSEVQKLIKEKNQEKMMLNPSLHFIYDSEQNSAFLNWCCHECLLNRCNGTSTTRHCSTHVYSFPTCHHQFSERFLSPTTSYDDDKLKVAIHHVNSSNTTCSCSFAKDILHTDKHKAGCWGDSNLLGNSTRHDSAITENNCKNSGVLPGDGIQVTPLIFQHLANEECRSMSTDVIYVGDFDGANCSVKLPNSASDNNCCNACYYSHCSIDKYCAFSVGANAQVMTWASTKNSASTSLNSKLFMDNLVSRPHLAARKLCQNEAVAKNSIVITESCGPLAVECLSEIQDSAIEQSHLSDEVYLGKNIHANCVKEINKTLIKKEKEEILNKTSSAYDVACSVYQILSKKRRLRKHSCCCWKTRRKLLEDCDKKLDRRRSNLSIWKIGNKVRKTNINGGVKRKAKKRLRQIFLKGKVWESHNGLIREYRTKNKVSNCNTKVYSDCTKPQIQVDLLESNLNRISGTNSPVLNAINKPSSQSENDSNSRLLNNVQQFVNFVKEIADSEQLVKVLTNSSEDQSDYKYNVQEKSIIKMEKVAKEIPSIQVKDEEINQSHISSIVFASVDTNSLSVIGNETELKRTLSNNDIHQSVNLIEINESANEEKIEQQQQPSKVRTNSWSEPSQMSLEQLDSEIKDLQENLKVDLVNEVLDNIEGAILLYEEIPEKIEDELQNMREEKMLSNKKLVRQSAKLCSSPDLIEEVENKPTSQVQRRPLRMIGGVMSRSVSLDEDEIDCGQWCGRLERVEKMSTNSMEEVDMDDDPGICIEENKIEGRKRAPPLVFITQPSDSFSESGVVLDENLDLDHEDEDEKDNDVDEDGSGRFDDNQSVEFPYSDDFESEESGNDDEDEEGEEHNGVESDEDIFYIPIDQLRGFSPPQIVVDKELVFELEGFSRKGHEFNSTQSCQVRHEESDQLKIEREEFTTSNIQVNASDGESFRFVGHYHNKELAASPHNLSKDNTELRPQPDTDSMDEDSKSLIDFSTPCDLINDDDDDDVFADTSYTLTPMDILIDYRMMSPGDRHRLYTIPELSSEYSSTPTEGILGSMSEADVTCLEEEEEENGNECRNESITPQNEVVKWCSGEKNFSKINDVDDVGQSEKNVSRDLLFHNSGDETDCNAQFCNKKITSPVQDSGELNANHRFQPQLDSSVVNPGIGLDSERDLGADTGDESSSCKKTGHLLIMQSDSTASSNNTLEGKAGVDVATVQAPAACRELWKLYKQFSEDSEDEGEAKVEDQHGMKGEEQPLTGCDSEREKEIGDQENSRLYNEGKGVTCEFESEEKRSNNSFYSVMSPLKDHNSNMSHDIIIEARDCFIQEENEKKCDKITENVNKLCHSSVIDTEGLDNINKSVEFNNSEYTVMEEKVVNLCVELSTENPNEMSNGNCCLNDVFLMMSGENTLNIDDRCVQRCDESCEGQMNNRENECVLTHEVSKDTSGVLSNHLSNRCRDQEIEITSKIEKENGEIETCNFQNNTKEFEVKEDLSPCQKGKMIQLSEVTWTKASQWVNPVKNSDALPPIKLLKKIDDFIINSHEENDDNFDNIKSIKEVQDKTNKTFRERSMTPDSLDEDTPNSCTLLKSWKLGQASPTTPTNIFVRNKLSPMAVPRNLYNKNTDLGGFSDLWGASTDSITFVFLGPASTFGQEGLFARNLRSPRSPGRCHALSNSWKLKHESLLPRSVSLDCINGLVQYSLTTRATSMESMIPEDLMNVVEKGRLHGIDLEEMRGDQTPYDSHQESTTPELCRALKYHSHSKNNSFLLPSRAFSQGSVVETPVSSKKSLAFERKTKKSVSWSDLSGQELTMEEGSITKRRRNVREIKPIIKKVDSSNFVHSDFVSNSCDYTETDAEEDLKNSALFTKIQKKRNPTAWVIAPQTQSFALKLPDHVKARIKHPKPEENVVAKNIEIDAVTSKTEEKLDSNDACQSAIYEDGSKSFSSVASEKKTAVTRFSDVINVGCEIGSEGKRFPLAHMVEQLLANKEIVEEVQRMENINQLNNNMKNADLLVPSSDFDWARLSVILSEASVFFQQLSTFCANRTKLVAQKSDQNTLIDNKNPSCRDSETQTNDTKNKMDYATVTEDAFSPTSTTQSLSLPSIFDSMNHETLNYLHVKRDSSSESNSIRKISSDDVQQGSKVDSAVQVDTLKTNRSCQGSYRFKTKRRREACLKKELEILTQEKGRIMKALDRCQHQNGYLNGNIREAEDVTTTDDELSPPDNPDYLISYQARLETACNSVVHKLEKLKETDSQSYSSTANSSLLNSPLSYSTDYLPIMQQNNVDTLTPFGERNGFKKHWQQKQLYSSSSSLSLSSTKSQSSDYLKPQEYCSQLINIRRNIVAASRNISTNNKTLNADIVKKSPSEYAKEERSSCKSSDKLLGNTAKDIENLLWECQAARHRAQHEIELAQEQLKSQRMAVQNLASVLQQKA